MKENEHHTTSKAMPQQTLIFFVSRQKKKACLVILFALIAGIILFTNSFDPAIHETTKITAKLYALIMYYGGLKFVPLGFKRLVILQSVHK